MIEPFTKNVTNDACISDSVFSLEENVTLGLCISTVDSVKWLLRFVVLFWQARLRTTLDEL